MPLENPDALLHLLAAHADATERAGLRIADAGTDRLERNVRRRTPVDTNPFRTRPDRPRGTLKASVHRQPGLERIRRSRHAAYRGTVETFDPVARYVEKDTPPHVIRARPGGMLHFQSRDGWVGKDGTVYPPGTWVTIHEVHHPGTKGQHMFSRGALATEEEVPEFARDPLNRWRREVESVHV